MSRYRQTKEETMARRKNTEVSAGGRFVSASLRPRAFAYSLLLTSVVLLTSGCRQDMQDQPKMKPYRATAFFKDGLSSRPPVTGTVARGLLRADKEFYTGKKSGAVAAARADGSTSPQGGQQAASQAATYPDDVELFPLTVTRETVTRGRERYEIFCSACHGVTGNGDGMIVRRGYRRAASFHTDALRMAPVGHYFDAITNGWGAMPPYASHIPPADRWAIVAYIRALQFSQQSTQAQSSASPSSTATPATSPESGGHR